MVTSIQDKGYDTERIRQRLIREKGVEYTCTMVCYKLRKQYKLPYMQNQEMPADAQKQEKISNMTS